MGNLISGTAVLAFAALSCSWSARTPQEPSDADWAWLYEINQKAFDALMPIHTREALVAYRSYHGTEVSNFERHFSIRFGPGTAFNRDDLAATVVFPIGDSVQRQLLNLRMKDRAASVESLLARVSIRRVSVHVKNCRAVKDRMDALSGVRLRMPERDVIALHAPTHRIVIDVGGGTVDATLYDERNPLVRWAVQTSDALLACVRAVSGDGRHSPPTSR